MNPRPSRCPVPEEARALQTLFRIDYEDAFGIEVDAGDRRSVLEWAQALFDQRSPRLRAVLRLVPLILRLPAEPPGPGEHVAGLTLARRTPDALVLAGNGPAVALRLVILAPTPRRPLTFATFVRFHRWPWRLVLPAHRRVARMLLAGAVAERPARRTPGLTA